MRLSSRSPRRAVRTLASLLLFALLAASTAWASPSNKWRLQMSGHAKVDGEIELSFTPKGGTASSVVVPVAKGTGENAAARLVRDTLKAKFGKDVYKVETDDGEDVLVKKRGSTPNFDLTLVESTVKGVRLNLQHE